MKTRCKFQPVTNTHLTKSLPRTTAIFIISNRVKKWESLSNSRSLPRRMSSLILQWTFFIYIFYCLPTHPPAKFNRLVNRSERNTTDCFHLSSLSARVWSANTSNLPRGIPWLLSFPFKMTFNKGTMNYSVVLIIKPTYQWLGHLSNLRLKNMQAASGEELQLEFE